MHDKTSEYLLLHANRTADCDARTHQLYFGRKLRTLGNEARPGWDGLQEGRRHSWSQTSSCFLLCIYNIVAAFPSKVAFHGHRP